MTSLLYFDDTKTSTLDCIGDTKLEYAFREIVKDRHDVGEFLKVLSVLPSDALTSLYRQNILKDFLTKRASLKRLLSHFGKLKPLYSEYIGNKKKLLGKQISLLQITSIYLKEFLSLLSDIEGSIRNDIFDSEGVNALKERVTGIVRTEAFKKLYSYAASFERMNPDAPDEALLIVLNDMGRIMKADFASFPQESLPRAKVKRSGFGFFKSKAEEPDDVRPTCHINQASYVLSRAVEQITEIFHNMLRSIYREFSAIADELEFFDTACTYCDYLEESGIRYCFPQFAEQTKIDRLYDIVLLSDSIENAEIISNDFTVRQNDRGIVIDGTNGAGKTVYIRSIVNAYILAQAGLPIPAESASIEPVSDIITIMAQAEDFDTGMSRFEKEAEQISNMLHRLKPRTLVFINEIFQATSYDEGAQGLFEILNCLTYCKTKWICATHLETLKELFRNDAAIMWAKVSTDHVVTLSSNV